MNQDYRWLNEASQLFLQRDYLLPSQSLDERVDVICQTAEKILNKPGFAVKIKENFKKGWYSFSTPIWTNFGNDRGLPISCFGSYIEDSIESILYTQAEVGIMSKYGGGTAAYFGNIRPRGSKIRDNGETSGAVHFMRLFDNIITIINQGDCYIEGTEVLTSDGFKDFRDIHKNDLIAQVDEHNNITFTKEYESIVNNFNGELVCLNGIKKDNAFSLKVTPNHRMVINRRKMKEREKYWSNTTEIVQAQNLSLHRDNRIPIAGWAGNGKGISIFDRIRIAYQADGLKDGENRKIRFHFSKKRKIDRLIWLLNEALIPYETYLNTDNTTSIYFDYIPELKKEKFNEWVKLEVVSGTWAKEFIDELSNWDSGKNKYGFRYSSTIDSNVDIVQALCCMANLKSVRSKREADEKRQVLHYTNISSYTYRNGDAIKITKENYNGKVYCVSVPTGRIVVRYNDRVCICGNSRRGNFAATLPIDHKDIEEFLTIKSDGSPLQHISFAVSVTDAFMQKMIRGDSAKRQIWAKVLQARANTGFPYITFIDNANKQKPTCYENMPINNSQLCQEIFLPNSNEESFVCDLSSMNVLYYDEWKDTDAVELLVYLLDAVMTEFIAKAKNIRFMERTVRFAERHRAVGIGWIGWHSYLQSLMIPFESMRAKLLNVEIIKQTKEKAYGASAKLAVEYGEPEVLKGHGRRNTTLLAIAPTKSSSFILGQASEGVEPIRSNYYIRDLQKGKFTIKNPYLDKLLTEKGKNSDEVWKGILKNSGSVQHLDFLSQNEKDVFKTFCEISPKEVVIQASQRQKYIDQGQSLNLMIHPSIPVKDVNKLVIEAWEMGIKSLYYQISVNAAQQFSRQILSCKSCES